MRQLSFRALALVLLFFVPACGSDPSGSTDAGPDVTIITDAGDVSVDDDATTPGDTTDTGGPTEPALDPCVDNLDCSGGEVCREGFCRIACTESAECDARAPVCDPSIRACVQCLDAADCDGPGPTCIDRVCRFGCGGDSDCADGQRCTADARCVVPECERDRDCRGGFRCNAFACIPIDEVICTPDASRCDGDTLVSCNRDGTRETRLACDDAVCIDNGGAARCAEVVCSPAEVVCLDNRTAGLCNDTGTDFDALPCRADQGCEDGVCTALACEPGVRVCEGEQLVVCSADGRTRTATRCDDTAECASNPAGCACRDATCVRLACRPGSRRCVGNASQRCNDLGTGFGAPETCGADELCTAGVCAPDRCERTSECGAGLFCIDGACEASPCDPRTCQQQQDAGLSPLPDTDNDGIPDCEEGLEPGPNGIPACLDPDQDGDGLLDGEEPNCGDARDARVTEDVDEDGWSDLLEILAGSDPCDAASTPEDLADSVLIVDAGGAVTSISTALRTMPPPVDVAIVLDTSGSMLNVRDRLAAAFVNDIATPLGAILPSLRWGLATYEDYPCPERGLSGDRPYRLLQRITSSLNAVADRIRFAQIGNGLDGPESAWEALYQAATGAGVTGCGMTVPAFNPATYRQTGIADGPRPGMGFRTESHPVIIHITDAQSHDASAYPSVSGAASRALTVPAVRDTLGATYVAIDTNGTSAVTTELRDFAIDTDSRVPTCAWGTSRPPSCFANECCTGRGGLGVVVSSGNCPLVTGLGSSDPSTGFAASIVSLVRGAVFGRRHNVQLSATASTAAGVDVANVVRAIVPTAGSAGASTCSSPTVDGERYLGVAPGADLAFRAEIRATAFQPRTSNLVVVRARSETNGPMGEHTLLILAR